MLKMNRKVVWIGLGLLVCLAWPIDYIGNRLDQQRELLMAGTWVSKPGPDNEPLKLEPERHFKMGSIAGEWWIDGSTLYLESVGWNRGVELNISSNSQVLRNEGGWHLERLPSGNHSLVDNK
jgi:hypothetical protein